MASPMFQMADLEDNADSTTIKLPITESTYLSEVVSSVAVAGIPEECEHDIDTWNIPAEDDEDVIDLWCDPLKPRVVNFQDVTAASFKIMKGISKTPCDYSLKMSRLTGMNVYFKKEFLQVTGSFKERGARYTLMNLTEEQKRRGVIAASAGNHALALSYHGSILNVPITVVMPTIAPLMKINACVQNGARVLIKGEDIGEARRLALKIAASRHMLYINGYDHPDIIAGQGSMGLEIVDQVPNVDAVVIPVGGGGLIAGSALAIKALLPHVEVIGVESERCASFTASMNSGKVERVEAESTIADGLAVPTPGCNSLATAKGKIDHMITVSEESIALSILRLIELEKAVVEGAGATGLAAILSHKLSHLKGKTVVVPLCGGNIDTTVLGRVIERGLAVDGRLIRFFVIVSDRPGGIAELTAILTGLGVSIKDIFHERAWLKSDIFKVQVKCIAETRDMAHAEELRQKLIERYTNVFWSPHDSDNDWMTEARGPRRFTNGMLATSP